MIFQEWYQYFQSNRNHFNYLSWTEVLTLSIQERKAIVDSIQHFQRGENSEGKHLLNRAGQLYSIYYAESIKLFIREEQTHARILGQFMETEKIPRIRNHWVDGVFRWLRNLSGLENSVMVLITAEIIAAVYYKALKEATNSTTLRSICDQILKDEEMHINFQSMALKCFHDKKSSLGKWIARLVHRTLMTATLYIVWLYHRQIYRSSGNSFLRFESETMQEYFRSHRMIIGQDIIAIRNQPGTEKNSEFAKLIVARDY